MGPVDLDHHGDDDLDPLAVDGQLDLAVNVRLARPPAWLQARLQAALAGLAAYPRPEAAVAAVAARHGRDPAQVLLTNGAAEAFTLLARGLRPRRAVCVHPSFTAPEAALRAAGHPVRRVLLPSPFDLHPDLVPDDADLVVVGNPTNPTARLHPVDALERLARPGRVLVVDEAFADAVGGEPASLAARQDLPGLVVVRSLTKTWGLAGLRVGYLLADPGLVARLAAAQPPWPVNSLALEALVACCQPDAVAWADTQARQVAAWRASLAGALGRLPGVTVVPEGQAPFLLLRVRDAALVRARLRDLGIAVRRGDTFPGLGPDWLRVAVAAPEHHDRILDSFSQSLSGARPTPALAAPPAAPTARPAGRVTLVGAGPGGADLITLRGWQALHAADVVVTDRLADPELTAQLRPGVRLVDAGKLPGAHQLSQEAITETRPRPCPRRPPCGPAQRRRPVRVRPRRRGGARLRPCRHPLLGGPRALQRHLGPHPRRHPRDPPRPQPVLHRALRPPSPRPPGQHRRLAKPGALQPRPWSCSWPSATWSASPPSCSTAAGGPARPSPVSSTPGPPASGSPAAH